MTKRNLSLIKSTKSIKTKNKITKDPFSNNNKKKNRVKQIEAGLGTLNGHKTAATHETKSIPPLINSTNTSNFTKTKNKSKKHSFNFGNENNNNNNTKRSQGNKIKPGRDTLNGHKVAASHDTTKNPPLTNSTKRKHSFNDNNSMKNKKKKKGQGKRIKPGQDTLNNNNNNNNKIAASHDTTKAPPLVQSSKSIKAKRKRLDNKKKKSKVKEITPETITLDDDEGGPSKDILDPSYFDADKIHKSTTMGSAKLFCHARRTILELLKARDYRPCLALLAAMIETCKFRTLAYWKVGEEIIRNCRPEELSLFLGSVVSGVRAPKNIPVWKEQLLHILNDQGYCAFMEQIESSIENNDNNPSISKLVALVVYEAWEQMIKKKQDDVDKMNQLLYLTKEQLSMAYHHNSTDRYIIKAYLKVLSVIANMSNGNSDSKIQHPSHPMVKQSPGIENNDCALKIKQVVDTALQTEINDPELMCILLYYGAQELKDDMHFAAAICSQDPVADARAMFLPTMKSMKSVLETDPAYTNVMMARVTLIVERLEHGVTDYYTLDELDDLLDELEFGPPHIRYNVMSFLGSINLPLTLDDLQLRVDDDDITALDTLEFLKFKVAEMISSQWQDTLPSMALL